MTTENLSAGGPGPNLIDQLLRESSWVHRLARALVASEADAEDLAQDVLADALTATDPPAPGRLRQWLAGIARHKAYRRYDARSRESLVLARAAMEPGAALTSAERLELHGDLARALASLQREDRDVLVRRHMDGVPPRQLAKELGIPAAHVRRRLHAARARLRGVLDKTELGRAGWARALTLLAVPPSTVPLTGDASPVRNSAASESVAATTVFGVTMSVTHLAMAAATLIVVSSLAWIALRPEPLPFEDPSMAQVARRGDETAVLPAAVAAAGDERRAAPARTVGAEADQDIAVPTVPDMPRLRFQDERGEVLLGVIGASVDEQGRLQQLEFRGDGTCAVPRAATLRVFARHAKACTAIIDVPALAYGDVHPVVLKDRPSIHAMLTVNQEAPTERLRFAFRDGAMATRIRDEFQPLTGKLSKLGFPGWAAAVECDLDGVIRAELPFEAEWVWSVVPFGYAVHSVDGTNGHNPEILALPVDGPVRHVNLMALPALQGRLVWEATGEPAPGDVLVVLVDGDGRSVGPSRTMVTNGDGQFRVPVHDVLEPSLEERKRLAARPQGITATDLAGERGVALRVTPFLDGADRSVDYEFPIAGEVYPIALGDIAVRRLRTVSVKVLGRTDTGWKPIDAAITSSRDAARSGADGAATVAVSGDDYLDVLAQGFEFVRVPLAGLATSDPVELRLEPAPFLEVRVPASILDPKGLRPPIVRVHFESSPFGSWRGSAQAQPELTHRLHRVAFPQVRSSGATALQQRYVDLAVDEDGVARLWGLRAGVSLDVALIDYRAGEYGRQSCVFDGPKTIETWPEVEAAWLTVTLTHASPDDALNGRFGMRAGRTASMSYSSYAEGAITDGPLAPGTFTLKVLPEDADGADLPERTFDGIVLAPGRNELSLDLSDVH